MTIQDEANRIAVETESDPLAKLQMEREDAMIEAGKANYWANVSKTLYDEKGRPRDGRGADLTPARYIMDLAHSKLTTAVVEWVSAQANKGKGRKHSGYRTISAIDADTVAFIALRCAFNHLALGAAAKVPKLAIAIGMALVEEATLRDFEASHAEVVHWIANRFNGKSRTHQRRVLRAAIMRKAPEVLERNAPDASYLQVGLPLIELIETYTGLVVITRTRSDSRVEMSETCASFWNETHVRAQYFRPEYAPTVVPPRPWSGLRNGGYHYALAGRLTLVKTRNKRHREMVKAADMGRVYAGINALQETPWKINARVLEVMKHFAAMDNGVGGLPQCRILPLPEELKDIPKEKNKRTPEQQERVDKRNKEYALTSIENARRVSGRHSLTQTISMAEQCADYDRIYFPYQFDFRGRVYPVTSFLTPQGTDFQKALLLFADAKPVGQDALKWLAIHGANTMADCPITGENLDKAPLKDRAKWVERMTTYIYDVAEDPYETYEFWSQADSPYMFLAFCFEWKEIVDALARNEVPVSSIAVALDGSCNGLQHFSALMRDEIGGASVNLIPMAKPADIYSKVKQHVIEILTEIAAGEPAPQLVGTHPTVILVDEIGLPEEEDEEEDEETSGDDETRKKVKRPPIDPVLAARKWLASGQIDRKLCKRPVMTMPYGSKKYGIRGQIMEELKKRKFKFEDGGDGFAEAGFLSGVIVDALGKAVVKAREVMDWLQHTATVLTKAGVSIEWTAPSGFPVLQEYNMETSTQVRTWFQGVLFKPRLTEEIPGTLNRARQINGVSPNFVHSLDAAAMIRTVARLKALGINHFAMIHDSYGTHAADTETMAQVLRDEFVVMYVEADHLARYEEAIFAALQSSTVEDADTLKINPTPRTGSLDLDGVRWSDFFFA